MRNVEIKAKVSDVKKLCELAENLSKGPPTLINQDDTFYKVNEGRLKMRRYSDSSATLVRYNRDNENGPKLCDYDLLQFSEIENEKANLLDKMLINCLGIRGRVIKERKLYMVGQTRIHIDHVQGLGDFMELEVVLCPDQTLEEGQSIAKNLQLQLGVRNEDLIHCAYVDLLDKSN
ncbi:hypothetical protein ACJJTC_019208 [Scirpophaga incertulas]